MRIKLLSSIFFATTLTYTQIVTSPKLIYETYLGTACCNPTIAVDSSGYSYVSGSADCSIEKVNPSGSSAVCVSVPASMPVRAIALDGSGAIYAVIGSGLQSGTSFVAQSAMVKIDADGNLIYSTPLPGALPRGLAVDRKGNVYTTGSAGRQFVATPGAYQTSLAPATSSAGFAVKLTPNGAVAYATFLDSPSEPVGVAADSQGRVWIVGASPSTSGGASSIDQLDANGGMLVKIRFGAVTSNGVSSQSQAYGVAVDSADAAYVVGTAPQGVPITPGVLQPEPPNPYLLQSKWYAIKYDSSGGVVYGTYLGDRSQGSAAIGVDGSGNAYVVLNGASQKTEGPALDCGNPFSSEMLVVNAGATALLASTFLNSYVQSIALDGKGGVYGAGVTTKTTFLATPGAYRMLYPGGNGSIFAAKLDVTVPDSGVKLTCAANAATLVAGTNLFAPTGEVAPGEILTLSGKGFGPDTTITFDGHPAPILYVSTVQVNTVVPFEVTGSRTMLNLNTAQQTIGPIELPVFPAVPGIFEHSVVNEDGTLNSQASPASKGSVITVYMTGAGLMSPAIADGALGPLLPPYPTPILGASASIDMEPASILFIGQAPTLVAGSVQVNIRIPDDAPSGFAKLVVYIGNFASAPFALMGGGLSIAIQ